MDVCPADDIIATSRRYRPDTLILETTFETADGLCDADRFSMPPRGNASHIVRMIRVDRGASASGRNLSFVSDSASIFHGCVGASKAPYWRSVGLT